ncbi:MAG: hypothetical protein V7L20_18360, partial [Nostoc sp.]|uniref:hypothetical protein n=1 Tax=Nostoc sp. TaxID=1180 RepID=UPI002FFA1EE7
ILMNPPQNSVNESLILVNPPQNSVNESLILVNKHKTSTPLPPAIPAPQSPISNAQNPGTNC